MAPYIICFTISCIFARLDEFFRKKNSKPLSVCFALLAILIPCILAGARNIGVGTDTIAYASPLFHTIRLHNYNIIGLFQSPYSSNIEPVTLLLYYFVSVVFDDIFWALFFTELICLLPVYLAIRASSIKSELKWLALFTYFCLFYCFTLNIMRQMMATCVLLYAFKYLKQKETGKYLIIVLLSMLIHKTAILGIFVWILYATCSGKRFYLNDITDIKYLSKKKSKFARINEKLYHNRVILLILYILVGISILFLIRNIIEALAFIKPSFAYQLENINFSFNPSVAPFCLMILYIIPGLLIYRKMVKKQIEYRFMVFACFMAVILWQLQGISSEMYRMAFYFWVFIIFAVPYFIQGFSDKQTRIFFTIYYVFLMCVNWYYYFVICNAGEVVPYTSQLLGIT